jgi:inner membrane protein
MDTVTQIVLGAVVGQAVGGERLGGQAALWGAVGGLIPDLDIVLTAIGPKGEFLYHRGPTHALWFGPLVGAALGWLLWRSRGAAPGMLGTWVALMIAALLTHPLLDVFTTYGTQLLTPFSRRRFATDAVAIIDPAYTILLVVALLVGWRLGWTARAAQVAAIVALTLSTAYLFYGWHLNRVAVAHARAVLASEGLGSASVRSYPTLFQPYLRRIVARNGEEIRIGWISLWNGRPITWQSFKAPGHPLIDAARSTEMGRVFEWFADHETVGSVRETGAGATVYLDDLRFGLPSAPQEGLWALRARFNRNGQLMAPIDRVRRRPPGTVRSFVRQIFQSTFN